MRTDSADRVFQKSTRHSTKTSSDKLRRQPYLLRSTSAYVLLAGFGTGALFFVLLLSGGDDAPWVPAGLAACLVIVGALGARQVQIRRSSMRYPVERDRADSVPNGGEPGRVQSRSTKSHSAVLRNIQKQSGSADAACNPEFHLDVYHSCREYLASTDEALRSPNVLAEKRVAMRAGQERVRTLQKHHLLSWAREASRGFTYEAQFRVRLADKLEAAIRALNVVGSALKFYPGDDELLESESAIREFMASAKIAHWLELAERAAFRGHYQRAIDRYRDALFYTSRETLGDEERTEMAFRIEREIAALRSRLQTVKQDRIPREPRPGSEGKRR